VSPLRRLLRVDKAASYRSHVMKVARQDPQIFERLLSAIAAAALTSWLGQRYLLAIFKREQITYLGFYHESS
jgi:hypothetical protein